MEHIDIWQDRTEANRPWIVSQEDGFTSDTLAVCETKQEALRVASQQAKKLGVSIQTQGVSKLTHGRS